MECIMMTEYKEEISCKEKLHKKKRLLKLKQKGLQKLNSFQRFLLYNIGA